MPSIRRACLALLVVSLCTAAFAKDTNRELAVNLKFAPQESVESSSPTLPSQMLDRSVELRVEDGRRGTEPATIGEGTNDDDHVFAIRASSDVVEFIKSTLLSVSEQWALKSGANGERVLTIAVSRYFVTESNKAVGSMYSAEVKLAFRLADAKGKVLAEGVGAGEAHRYGRARSGDNCNEVLSDALKEAYAGVLSDSALQSAWTTGKGNAAAAAKSDESAEERLRKLDALYKKGLITKEEYEKKRAEILKEL